MYDIKWYLSYELVVFELDPPEPQEDFEVWENHVLIRADSPEEAYEKAMKHGTGEEGPWTIDEKKARLRFLGLKDLIAIYDDLEDGAEIEWTKKSFKREELAGLVIPKENYHAFTADED